jgi:RimJ/RimL family protein N-acetyltransferase
VQSIVLRGEHIRLAPLERSHIDDLVRACAAEPGFYQWSAVPLGREQVIAYIDKALASREAGTAFPFVTVRAHDGAVIGSTRFFDIERWAWPENSPRYGRDFVDGCEIGYTWLTPSAIRTAANTEAKLLMLAHAFENWRALRVCLHTDVRNKRSATAIERIGAKFEGILRSHRMATDGTARDSMRYSILAAEWPEVKSKLSERLSRV